MHRFRHLALTALFLPLAASAQQALTQIAGDIVKQPIAIVSALIALVTTDARFTVLADPEGNLFCVVNTGTE